MTPSPTRFQVYARLHRAHGALLSRPLVVGLGPLLILMFSILILLGEKQFYVWEQIISIAHVNPLELILMGHPHALRFLVVWPAIAITKLFDLNLTTVFSLYVLLALYLLCITLARCLIILRHASPEAAARYTTLFMLFWLPFSLLMNGRMVFGFLGISILILAQLRWIHSSEASVRKHATFFMLHFLGLLLCSVSSGVFTVAFGATQLFIAGNLITHYISKKRIIGSLLVVNLGLLALFLPLQTTFVMKNYDFFNNAPVAGHEKPVKDHGEGVEADKKLIILLDAASKTHGWLRFLPTVSHTETTQPFFTMFLVISTALLLVSCFLSFMRNSLMTPLISILGLGIIIGMFGDSTLLTILLPLQLCIGHFFLRGVSTRSAWHPEPEQK